MRSQIAIISLDDLFSRMLELEFQFYQLSVKVIKDAEKIFSSDVALLDLDTMPAPTNGSYFRMIGYTRSSALSSDDARRQCAMILHRPFEMNILRREVFDILHQKQSDRNECENTLVEVKNENITSALILKEGKLLCSGVNVPLSKHETQILQALLEKKGEAVSREALSSLIGKSSANKVDVYICYLRRKIESACGCRVIGTVRGKGYKILC